MHKLSQPTVRNRMTITNYRVHHIVFQIMIWQKEKIENVNNLFTVADLESFKMFTQARFFSKQIYPKA